MPDGWIEINDRFWPYERYSAFGSGCLRKYAALLNNHAGTPINSLHYFNMLFTEVAALKVADGKNIIEVTAYAKDNLVAARGVQVLGRKMPEKAAAPPVLHAIIAGVSAYEGASMSLQFPAKDALDIAHALEVGGKRLFGVGHVDIATFVTGSTRHRSRPKRTSVRRFYRSHPKPDPTTSSTWVRSRETSPIPMFPKSATRSKESWCRWSPPPARPRVE